MWAQMTTSGGSKLTLLSSLIKNHQETIKSNYDDSSLQTKMEQSNFSKSGVMRVSPQTVCLILGFVVTPDFHTNTDLINKANITLPC